MKVGKYTLHNEEKVDRALNGALMSDSTRKGGVADKEGKFVPSALLAEYDKLGGYITNEEGSKVVSGSFYDIKSKKPFEKPEVVLIFKINGKDVKMKEGEKKPQIIQAAEILEKEKKKLAKEKADKKKKKKK